MSTDNCVSWLGRACDCQTAASPLPEAVREHIARTVEAVHLDEAPLIFRKTHDLLLELAGVVWEAAAQQERARLEAELEKHRQSTIALRRMLGEYREAIMDGVRCADDVLHPPAVASHPPPTPEDR